MQKELTRLAKLIQADYRYDPLHENRPQGQGWRPTKGGWTNILLKHDTKEVQKPNQISDNSEIRVKNAPSPVIPDKRKIFSGLITSADQRGLIERDGEGKALVEQKDVDRITSMSFKSRGNEDKIRMYVENMSNAITNPKKAIRRGLAAFHGLKEQYGQDFAWEMASVFVKKGLTL